MQTNVKHWLQERRMLQSRLKIKCFDNKNSKWVPAPIMQTETTHSNMLDWKAQWWVGRFPCFQVKVLRLYPSHMPQFSVSICRNCVKVRLAATIAYKNYKASQCLQLRQTRNFKIWRREFPDRCYLTRSQQLDADQFWNQDQQSKMKIKPVLSYEKGRRRWTKLQSNRILDMKCQESSETIKSTQTTWSNASLIKSMYACITYIKKWNHVNVWRVQVECGTEDYVLFFEMLRSLKVHEPCIENSICTDAPVLSSEDDEDVKLSMTQASCDYRFCFYELDATTCTQIEQINACYYTKKNIRRQRHQLENHDI